MCKGFTECCLVGVKQYIRPYVQTVVVASVFCQVCKAESKLEEPSRACLYLPHAWKMYLLKSTSLVGSTGGCVQHLRFRKPYAVRFSHLSQVRVHFDILTETALLQCKLRGSRIPTISTQKFENILHLNKHGESEHTHTHSRARASVFFKFALAFMCCMNPGPFYSGANNTCSHHLEKPGPPRLSKMPWSS